MKFRNNASNCGALQPPPARIYPARAEPRDTPRAVAGKSPVTARNPVAVPKWQRQKIEDRVAGAVSILDRHGGCAAIRFEGMSWVGVSLMRPGAAGQLQYP